MVRYGLFGIAVFEKNTFLLWKKRFLRMLRGRKIHLFQSMAIDFGQKGNDDDMILVRSYFSQ